MPERFTRPAMLAGFAREFVNIRSAADPDAEREAFMERTRATAARFFEGREELVASVLEEMDAMLRALDDRFPDVIATKLSKAFEDLYRDPETAQRFHEHLRKVEREEREKIILANKGIVLSPQRMLYGMLDEDSDRVFRIHVAVAFTLEPAEKMVDFRKGMRELARIIQEDPAFANVEEIVGTSWLVGEHPSIAKRMGFHVDKDPLPPESAARFGGETRKVQRSWMSRDELIAQYGEKRMLD